MRVSVLVCVGVLSMSVCVVLSVCVCEHVVAYRMVGT